MSRRNSNIRTIRKVSRGEELIAALRRGTRAERECVWPGADGFDFVLVPLLCGQLQEAYADAQKRFDILGIEVTLLTHDNFIAEVNTQVLAIAIRDPDDESRATSINFCDDERAWKRRRKLLDKSPTIGISTLRGMHDAETNSILQSYAPYAPKLVLSVLTGRRDPEAFALREQLWDTGREVVDSIRGLDVDAAWTMRERAVETHPSTVVHSMLGLSGPRVEAMRARCETLGAGDIHLMRRVQGLIERPDWPEWVRTRSHAESDD